MHKKWRVLKVQTICDVSCDFCHGMEEIFLSLRRWGRQGLMVRAHVQIDHFFLTLPPSEVSLKCNLRKKIHSHKKTHCGRVVMHISPYLNQFSKTANAAEHSNTVSSSAKALFHVVQNSLSLFSGFIHCTTCPPLQIASCFRTLLLAMQTSLLSTLRS